MSELNKALAAVLGEVHRVPKRGRNTFHQYDYTTEADLLETLRPLLAAHGLSVTSSTDEITRYDPPGVVGRDGTTKGADPITRVKMSFTIRHASGEALPPQSWFGEGQDRGDKGIYKAQTGCVKYFMFKQFLVSTGDDPEVDDDAAPTLRQSPRDAAPAETPRDEAPAPSAPSSLSCAERLKAYVDRHNKDWKSVGAAQRALGMDNERALKLPAEQLKTLVEYLEAQEASA